MNPSGAECRRLDGALDESQDRLWSLLQSLPVGLVISGPAAELKYCNPAALELLDVTADQLVGSTSFDPKWQVIHEDGSPCICQDRPIPRTIATRQPVHHAVIGVYRSNKQDWRWLLVDAAPRLAKDGSVLEVICSFLDITEHKRALATATEWKQRYEAAIHGSEKILYDCNAATNDVTYGGDYERILGYSAEEMKGGFARWLELIHPDDRDAFVKEAHRIRQAHERFCVEYRVRNSDGVYQVLRDEGGSRLDGSGNLSHVAGILSDVTDRKRAEDELRESEQRFRKAFADAAVGMTVTDLLGRYLYANRAHCQITGYTEQELPGINWRAITHPEDVPRNRELVLRMLAGQFPSFVIEKRCIRKDGTMVWVRNSVSVLRDSGNEPIEIIALSEDITERKQAEAQLRTSEERFRKVFANAATGMTLKDLEGGYLEVNQAFCDITGYTEQELAKLSFQSITHPEDLPEYSCRMQELQAGKVPSFVIEKRYVRKDGTVVWARNSVSLLGDSNHEPTRVITLVEDITERKQAEEALRQLTVRLLQVQDEERRRLARELHDGTAQNIAALGMNLGVVNESANRLDWRARKALQESVSLADQCIHELRTFSYLLHPPLLDDRGLAAALASYAEGFTGRSGIAIEVDITPDLGRLPQEVELVLFRIVQESLANIHRHSRSRTAVIHIARFAQEVLLEVIDQGCGMSSDLNDRTEPRMGVGIAGMRERVRQIGGQLSIRSRPEGTDVEVIVPLSGQPA